MKKLLELKNITKEFRLSSGSDLTVLKDFSLDVFEDDFVAIVGPTGVGKSTTLRLICGLTKSDSGEIVCGGKKIEGINPNVSLVFQDGALFPWESVYGNIDLALEPLGLASLERKKRAEKAIELVGLEGFEEAYPRELSGGMKQRVGLARALVMEREIMLLDEPFSSLDKLSADALRTELVELWQEKKTLAKSLILVTHDIPEAVQMAKRILVMGRSPAQICFEIKNDLPYPRDDRSPLFERMVNRVHDLLAEAIMPDAPVQHNGNLLQGVQGGSVRLTPIEALPQVQISELMGFLELIAEKRGQVNMFELAQEMGTDFGSTLYMAKAAELLYLVDTPRQIIMLTPAGKQFVDAELTDRKKIMHTLFGRLQIVQMATNFLSKNDENRVLLDDLIERVAEWVPHEDPKEVVDVLINWGRFSEYFGYNDDTRELYLSVEDA